MTLNEMKEDNALLTIDNVMSWLDGILLEINDARTKAIHINDIWMNCAQYDIGLGISQIQEIRAAIISALDKVVEKCQ